jgi:tetratricopeptide (TPR) repeat protein
MKKITLFIAVFLVLPFSMIASHATATDSSATLESLKAKLERWDVEEIWPAVQQALEEKPQDADLLETAALIAFYRGDYQKSLDLIKRTMAVAGADQNRSGLALFVEQTINVLASFQRYETPHFIIFLDGTQDGILVDYLTDALEKTYAAMALQYGFQPREKVRVELFPDANAFYQASTLSVRDIEVTGAVGLTKFNKLQFLSPRALMYGYRWLDAISHEYMHYLIVKMTANNAPIWFHEGLSKYEETRWRAGPSYLSPLYQTLLARAQADQKLIAFAKMEPSLIHLETPEEVQLAYAQAACAIEFIINSAGYEGLKQVMSAIARSRETGAGDAIKEMLGIEVSEFEEQWAKFLASKELAPVAGVRVQRYKVMEGKVDAQRMDLEEIKSLVARNRAHLGDRLRERGRTGAAVIEYRRALSETQDSVPVMNRLSSALIDLGMDQDAVDVLKRILRLAPDHPTPYTLLGQVYLKSNDFEQAKAAFEQSIQINPFNPEVHAGLADARAILGDTAGSEKEKDIARTLVK